MKVKLKINNYAIVSIIVIFLIVYLILNQFKTYQQYNEVVFNQYKEDIEAVEQSLSRLVNMSQYFLENSFVRVQDKKNYAIEQGEDGSYNTNSMTQYVPEKFTGNYYGLYNYMQNLDSSRKFQLISYVDDSLYQIYNRHSINWEKYSNKESISTVNLVMDDLYIYKFPFQYFEEGSNPYEQKMEQYGERYLKNVSESNSLTIKELHKNNEGEYVFTLAYPIKNFDESIGYISIDFLSTALGKSSNKKVETFILTKNRDFIASNSESLIKSNSIREVELFVNSSMVNRCKILMQRNTDTFYFAGDKIFFFNEIPKYDIVIINAISAIDLLGVIVPIIIILILSIKTVTILIKYSYTRKKVIATVKELEAQNSKIEEALKEDYLTNISTKVAINDILEKEIKNYTELSSFCVCICDIDNIKKMNTTHGYYAGDMALKHVTKIIKNNIKKDYEIAMWNVPQILIILKDIESEEAYEIINNIRIKIEQTPLILKGGVLNLTASFGIAKYKRNLLKNKLLVNAEKSLIVAKNSGKNMVVLHKDK